MTKANKNFVVAQPDAAQASTPPETAPPPAEAPKAETKPEPTIPPKADGVIGNPTLADVDKTLVQILAWKRKHGTAAEAKFTAWLREQIKKNGGAAKIMVEGNIVAAVPTANGNDSDVLFSCHVDTVHSGPGTYTTDDVSTQRQGLAYDEHKGHLMLDAKSLGMGACLGADDGAGVWLMLEMIKAKVPGTYLFHRGEESGFIGSSAMVDKEKEFLAQFSIAVAFDRPFVNQVITHQSSMRCCSDKFAGELAKRLNDTNVGLSAAANAHGGLTDTHKYRGIIAECTNVSVGYYNQHRDEEYLDLTYLLRLRAAVLQVNWGTLPIDRDPKVIDEVPAQRWHGRGSKNRYSGSYGTSGHGAFDSQRHLGFGGRDDDDGWDFTNRSKNTKPTKPKKEEKHPLDLSNEKEIEGMAYHDVVTFVEEMPSTAAVMLIDMASEIAALKLRIDFLKGALQ